MNRSEWTPILWSLLPIIALLNGCTVSEHYCTGLPETRLVLESAASAKLPHDSNSPIRQASFEVTTQPPQMSSAPSLAAIPFAGLSELSLQPVVEQVLLRNQSLAQMTAAWRVAAARYPQVTSLDDPMFGATVGPASFGSNEVDGAYRLEVSQRLPFPGKLQLKGQNALAETAAACNDVNDMRLQLIEGTCLAFFDYYLVERSLEVNRQNLMLLQEFRRNAESRYKTGLVTQQDVLQADVEIGRQRERLLTIERMRSVSVARLNTLMHLAPDLPLPPPPKTLTRGGSLPPVSELRTLAVARRPDLQAVCSRIEADRTALSSAFKEYNPDFEVMAAYDAFWQRPEQDLRPMIGIRMNLPSRLAKRDGAVAETRARIAQRQAEYAKLVDQTNFEVQQAYAQVHESERALQLNEDTILPAARENVKAAQTEYVTGKIPFLSLVEAQRSLVGLLDRYYETTAEYQRRRATLERVTGGPITTVIPVQAIVQPATPGS